RFDLAGARKRRRSSTGLNGSNRRTELVLTGLDRCERRWHIACPLVTEADEAMNRTVWKRRPAATRLFVAATAVAVLAFVGGPALRRLGAADAATAVASSPKRMSDAGLAQIRQHEAFMGKPYDDGAGNETIGYGHLILEGESYSGGITEA